MKKPVIAIGLDAADPVLLEKWISQGHLKTLARLREQGAYGRLENIEYYKAETPWTTFLTGCHPQKTGYWGPIKFHEGTYNIEEVEAYDFAEYSPFYALGEDYRVAAFDIPQSALNNRVNGQQVLAWGAHSPQTPSHSQPADLLPQLIEQYGAHPALHKDHGDWWDQGYLKRLYQSLKKGISLRSKICRDWLQQESWDLFLTIFSETHSAGHDLWYLSQADHPLYPHKPNIDWSADPLLDIFEAVDRAIADIIDAAPPEAQILIFAAHGSDNNTTDVASMFFLPEFLYRFSFPGQRMFPSGKVGSTPPPIVSEPQRRNWAGEIWQLKCDRNPLKQLLRRWAPGKIQRQLDQYLGYSGPEALSQPDSRSGVLAWQPTTWYQSLWPQMKAFALPSFSEGYIRINLQGREPAGIVSPAEYDALCDELTQHLYALKDARTGQPVVKKVVKTRQHASDRDPKLPDADLTVVWQEQPTDVIDSPTFGRIGPVAYRRTGSHRARGFLLATGPDITPGSTIPTGQAVDLAPTILNLMGAPIPAHCDGKPLIEILRSLATSTS